MQYFALATMATGALAINSIERDVARFADWQSSDAAYCKTLRGAAKRADLRCQYEGEFMNTKEVRDLAMAEGLHDRFCKQGTFLRAWNRGEALWYNLGNYWSRGETLDYNDSAQVTRSATSPGAGWFKIADANATTTPKAPRDTIFVKRFVHISDLMQVAEARNIKFDDVDYPIQSLADMLNCEHPSDDIPPMPTAQQIVASQPSLTNQITTTALEQEGTACADGTCGCTGAAARPNVMFFRTNEYMNWPTGKHHCESMGMQMAEARTTAENTALTTGAPNSWIGGRRYEEVNYWDWVWNSDTSYINPTHWNGGEPNNAGSEKCLQMYTSGRWNDLHCGNNLNIVCEQRSCHA